MQATQNATEKRIALIAKGGLDPKEVPQLLDKTFDAPDYLTALRGCTEAQRYIDGLYEVYRNLPSDSSSRQRCFRALRKAGGVTKLLPSSYHVSFQLKKQGALANAAGGFSDVWKADGPAGSTFALKVLRITQQDDFLEIKKRFCKEVLVAKQVKHDNVLAVEGVQMSDGPKFCIVSEWMELGNLHTYLENNEVADRVELLLGVTKGLNYLHSIEVIHGDLKSTNILIDLNGNPRLTDFGFSSITRSTSSANDSTPNGRGSIRWRAPELLALSTKPKDLARVRSARPTNKSDVYSLAMVVIEIFTGRHPFDSHSDEQVILLLAGDSRPEKPVHGNFTSGLWSLTKKCWNKAPSKRPDVPEILKKLESRDGNNGYALLPALFGASFSSKISLPFGERSDTNH